MNDHAKYVEWLPLYVRGSLEPERRSAVEKHLANCPACQSDAVLWRAVARQVAEANRPIMAPPLLADRALARVRSGQASIFRRAWDLLCAQAPLVRGEIWLASAAVMAIGVIVATIVHDVAVLRMLAPMVAAAGIAVIYGPEHDPALELSLATATSPWEILLARLTLVFSYNLALALAASLGMLALLPAETVARLILDWLGPMTFLSAAALVLALCIGTGNAILVAYLVWIARFLPGAEIARTFRPGDLSILVPILNGYRQFWTSPLLLVALAMALVAGAAWLAGRQEHHLPHWA